MSQTEQPAANLARNLARDLDRHFDELVLAYQRPLFLFAYRMSGCTQDAEEVVQDVFVRAYRALKTYETDRIRSMALRAWLYRICVNLTRNHGRRKHVPTVELFEDGHAESGPADPTADGYLRDQAARELHILLRDLPPRYRAPVVLRHINELSYEEIAQTLEQPEGTVKSNVHRGLALLRSRMAAQEDSHVPIS